MKIAKASVVLISMLISVRVLAQEFPRFEVGGDYSYARYQPSAAYTKGHSLNGGGGSAVINFNEYFGFKMDLQGYGSNTSYFTIPVNTNFPDGGNAKVQGNLFTYLFGPQIKFRTPKFQPFGHLLFGGAHSNVYGNAFKAICSTATPCAFSKAPAGDAFAMAVGGGIDIPIHKNVQFRPAEVDYLMTNFSNQFNNTNQNNFRFSAGINFTFGNTSH
jgi:hypothetical protein